MCISLLYILKLFINIILDLNFEKKNFLLIDFFRNPKLVDGYPQIVASIQKLKIKFI